MRKKILSVFVDESGDFGQYNPSSPYYYVAMVLHNQEIDLTRYISALEKQICNWGYPGHAIHTGPLIRRESFYKNDLRENRKALFNALYHFTRMVDIKYICPQINQGECTEKTKLAYTEKLTKEIISRLRENYAYIAAFDLIIVYYDYGQIELAQILLSVLSIFTKSEAEFFHSKSDFKKNIYKNIAKKKL